MRRAHRVRQDRKAPYRSGDWRLAVNLEEPKGGGQRSKRSSQLSIELNIEELVLHGFARDERYEIGDSVERQLTRLLNERGIPDFLLVGNTTDDLTGVPFNARNTKPFAIGQQIAQAVYRGFNK
jgi:hypothetical protein